LPSTNKSWALRNSEKRKQTKKEEDAFVRKMNDKAKKENYP